MSRFRPRSVFDVLATLAFFGVLAGGTAYAANTVFSGDIVDGQVKTPDLAAAGVTAAKIANNAVNSVRIEDGQVGIADLSTDARTHSFNYGGLNNDPPGARHVVVNLGGLRVAVRCDALVGTASMEVFTKNVGTAPGQLNAGWVSALVAPPSIQNKDTGIDGFVLNPGDDRTIDVNPFNVNTQYLIGAGGDPGPAFSRAEGQIFFHPNDSNDIVHVSFHAYVNADGHCEFQGTVDRATP